MCGRTDEAKDRLLTIIDTDVACDDWMAMLYLFALPWVDVKAITVVGTGGAHRDAGVKIVHGLMKLANQVAVPVGCGLNQPLKGHYCFPETFRQHTDEHYGVPLPDVTEAHHSVDAITLLKEVLLAAETPVSILALGPLTNLATLLRNCPQIVPKIKQLVIMGGALQVPGNVYGLDHTQGNPFAEWNFYTDPLAVKIVLASGVNNLLVPLDVTRRVPMTPLIYEQFLHLAAHPCATFIAEVISKLLPKMHNGDIHFWDPLAAAIVSGDIAYSTRYINVDIVTDQGDEWARLYNKEKGYSLCVVDDIDADMFYQRFLHAFDQS